MTTVPVAALVDSIVNLLTEAYAGPPDPSSTWFIDNEPDSGILGTIDRVSAAEASQSMDGKGGPGSTIASNVEHLRWSLAQSNAAMRGEPFGRWKESWQLAQADPATWDRLRENLRTEFEVLRNGLLSQSGELQGDMLTEVLALLPHAAFHLGIIRQMLERVRER